MIYIGIGPLPEAQCPFHGPRPLLLFEPEAAKKMAIFPFIFEKWRQLEGVRATNPPISGAALVDAPK